MSRLPKPEKMCKTCGRPFQWRKKWRHCWDEVRYCSERCRRFRYQGSLSGAEGRS
ncbi:MAG: DUF2256 domain-containing protein [Desulfofustis sp.]|nr:DUF2256 domain-containing protein [Desulfofustis sp.]